VKNLLFICLLGLLTASTNTNNLVADGQWQMYNKMGNDSLSQNCDGSLHLDTAENTDRDPGIFHEIDLSKQPRAEDGQPLHVKFWAKSSDSQPLTAAVMQSKYPFAQTTHETQYLTPSWKQYEFDCVAPGNADGLWLHFKTKGATDIKEIGVTAESAADLGLNAHDLTAQGCESNIDKYRKGKIEVEVLDQSGKPLPKADVQIKQTKQSFLFGTEIQGLNPDAQSQSQLDYQKALKETFNFATVTPYWPHTEKHSGQVNFDSFDKQIDWLSANDMTIKAHPAFWPHYTPGFVPSDPEQAAPMIDEHTKQFAEHFSKFPHMRFIENNEICAAEADASQNGAINWVKKVGAVNAVEKETAIEQKAIGTNHPVEIVYNDYQSNEQEMAMLDRLQADGKLPDAIGIQMHMTQGNWPLEKVEHIINKLSKYGRPIYISEISVLSGEHRIGSDDHPSLDWKSTRDGEREQTEYVEKLYRVLYSNRHVKGITWWDLSDKNSWQGAPRGLLREDMSPKPAYDRLHNLIQNEWRSDVHTKTDESGAVEQRVFAGDYDITVSDAQGHQVQHVHAHVDEGEDCKTVKIKLDGHI